MNHSHPRRAFVLIELLVVISTIAILVNLLLPAVQQANSQAHRGFSPGAAVEQHEVASTPPVPLERPTMFVVGRTHTTGLISEGHVRWKR